jgi:hypothetical protein
VKISAGIVGCLLVLAASAVFGGGLGQAEQTLDNFHRAAAVADRDGYLALTTEDVVFLGTDGSERWQGEEFRDFVEGHFSAAGSTGPRHGISHCPATAVQPGSTRT